MKKIACCLGIGLLLAACFEDGPADGHINARQFAV